MKLTFFYISRFFKTKKLWCQICDCNIVKFILHEKFVILCQNVVMLQTSISFWLKVSNIECGNLQKFPTLWQAIAFLCKKRFYFICLTIWCIISLSLSTCLVTRPPLKYSATSLYHDSMVRVLMLNWPDCRSDWWPASLDWKATRSPPADLSFQSTFLCLHNASK